MAIRPRDLKPQSQSPGPTKPEPQNSGRQSTFYSLKDPNFAWFFVSTLGQMAAVFMQMLVRGFLVFQITGSFAALGFLSLASAVPQVIFGFYGGVLADRFSKKLVTQIGQTVGFLNVLAMGLIAAFGTLEFWHLVASGVGSGLLVGMMMPARQAMVHEVVKGGRLMNAISLNTAGMNTMQIIAPAVGGVVLATWSAEGAFFVMSACYLVAIFAMSFVQGQPAAHRGDTSVKAAVADIADGIRYVRNHRELRPILNFTFLAALLGSAYMPVFPGFVADVLTSDPKFLGVLIAVSAVGALAGSLVLASLPDRRRGQLLIGSAIVLGVGLIGLSASSLVWVAIPFMIVIGIGQAGRQSIANTLLQTYSKDAYRGRVMALFMMQFAMMSIGAFIIGMLATVFSIQAAFGIVAVGLVAVGIISALKSPTLRNIE